MPSIVVIPVSTYILYSISIYITEVITNSSIVIKGSQLPSNGA